MHGVAAASVTVTVYVPAEMVVITEVVAPVLHKYVYAPVPPLVTAVNPTVWPLHTIADAGEVAIVTVQT